MTQPGNSSDTAVYISDKSRILKGHNYLIHESDTRRGNPSPPPGLTFQTAADARAFDKGVKLAVEDIHAGT